MRDDAETSPVGAPPYHGDGGCAAESTSDGRVRFTALPFDDPRHFRDLAGRLTARLLRRFGAQELERIDDAVQDAFVAATRTWGVTGVPAEPLAWLSRVATRRFIDRARSDRRLEWQSDAGVDVPHVDAQVADGAVLDDDQLRLLFLCCHPSLSAESRVALTLKCAAQFSVDEIARLLRADRTAVAQRLVRAKRTLQEHRATFLTPSAAELPERLDDVLAVCYALFAEGHHATQGVVLVREELCHEALRLVLLLAAWPPASGPGTQALLALLCLTAARLPARVATPAVHGADDGAGRDADTVEPAPVALRAQDRSQWHRALITRGVRAFAASASGGRYTRYHAEAEIAMHHTLAPSWEATPWDAIVHAYDRLLRVAPSPMVRLARWVALAEAGHATTALAELETGREQLERDLGEWPEWWATQGLLLGRVGRTTEAVAAYDRALGFDVPTPVRRFWTNARAGLA